LSGRQSDERVEEKPCFREGEAKKAAGKALKAGGIRTELETKTMPADLDKRLRKLLNDEPALSGDQALVQIAGAADDANRRLLDSYWSL
jgi:hypothetical protein